VIADCETGFGNVVNVTRAVHDFIDAGVAGFFLEDQVFPKHCGYTKGVEVIPIPDAVAKYRAACDARDAQDSDVVVLARTDRALRSVAASTRCYAAARPTSVPRSTS
jgi:2-methylisocitrate lyase-like PEP mutase family enzyme